MSSYNMSYIPNLIIIGKNQGEVTMSSEYYWVDLLPRKKKKKFYGGLLSPMVIILSRFCLLSCNYFPVIVTNMLSI